MPTTRLLNTNKNKSYFFLTLFPITFLLPLCIYFFLPTKPTKIAFSIFKLTVSCSIKGSMINRLKYVHILCRSVCVNCVKCEEDEKSNSLSFFIANTCHRFSSPLCLSSPLQPYIRLQVLWWMKMIKL